MKFFYDKTPRYRRRLQLTTLMSFLMVTSAVVLGATVITDTHIDMARRTITDSPATKAPKSSPFGHLNIEAEAVHVWDVTRGETLFARNDTDVHALASITKIATALTAIDLAPRSAIVSLDKQAIQADGDNGLRVDERWHLDDLLDFTLVVSSNDGARGIASVAGARYQPVTSHEEAVKHFVDAMNRTARDIGLEKTVFYNPSGLDINETQSGGYGTARDVSQLMAHALQTHPSLLEPTQYQRFRIRSLSDISHVATNTNPETPDIPGLLASKTGYTDISGGNLVIAFDPFVGRPIIVTVLGSTYDGRFDDIRKLMNASIAAVRSQSQ